MTIEEPKTRRVKPKPMPIILHLHAVVLGRIEIDEPRKQLDVI